MTNAIVQVNVSQTIAPAPNKLQRTGALISQGGTNLPTGTYSLLTAQGDLTPLLPTPQAITSLTWLSSVVTATCAVAHGYPVGETINLTVAGVTPAGYNGTFACTIASTTTFTYALVANPGTQTVAGTVVATNTSVLSAMVNTFYDQPGQLSVYVLELGPNTAAAGIAALDAYIIANPGFFYSYLIPRGWDADATYAPFVANFNSTTAKVYFYTTVTLSTFASLTSNGLNKCCPVMIESVTPALPADEYSMAAMFWATLNANPSSSNKVPPLCFTFLVGVTAGTWTGPQLTSFKSSNVNFVATGAEGGISNTMLQWGNMPDGNPWNYWYSADWTQINLDLNISNTIINGSNTTINPLYYDQQGVNRLQASAVQTMQQAISFGLALGQLIQTQLDPTTFANNVSAGLYVGNVVVNAIPFATWTAANPSTFSEGIYGGMAALYTPARGFEQILFNLNVSNIA
jgi:hypothetical protein